MKIYKVSVNRAIAPNADIFYYAVKNNEEFYHLILDGSTWIVKKDDISFIDEVNLGELFTFGPASHYTSSTTETVSTPAVSLRDLLGQDIAEIRLK